MKTKLFLLAILLVSFNFFSEARNNHNCKVWDFGEFSSGNNKFTEVYWTGEIKHNKGIGYGTAYFDDGSRFEGKLDKGVPNGMGKYLRKGSFCGCAMDNSVIVSYWSEGLPSGSTSIIFSSVIPVGDFWSSYNIKYISGRTSAGNLSGSWYAYETNGGKVGWVSMDNGGKKMTIHEEGSDSGIGTFVGVLGALGVGLVGMTALAAATMPEEIFILIIIIH